MTLRRPPGFASTLAVSLIIVSITAAGLRLMGRVWTCGCGDWAPWSGDTQSPHNSQHLLDPYSLTHLEHGVLLGLLLTALPRVKRWRPGPRWLTALSLEALWELIENTPWVINRYRESTLAIGYFGDSVLNAVGDIASFGLGYLLTKPLGWRPCLALLLTIEGLLLWTIRDNLLLNVLMLFWPIDAVRQWQTMGAN